MRILCLLTLLLSASSFAVSQSDAVERAVLNYAEGKVFMQDLPGFASGDVATLYSGQNIRTEEGKAELYLVLNSITFVRMGNNSHVEIVHFSDESATVRLHAGTMIVDTFGVKPTRFSTFEADPVKVQIGNAETKLSAMGESRFETTSRDDWSVQPLTGEAMVSEAGNELVIKKGRAAHSGANGLEKIKATRLGHDSLSDWHKERTRQLTSEAAIAWANGKGTPLTYDVLFKGAYGDRWTANNPR